MIAPPILCQETEVQTIGTSLNSVCYCQVGCNYWYASTHNKTRKVKPRVSTITVAVELPRQFYEFSRSCHTTLNSERMESKTFHIRHLTSSKISRRAITSGGRNGRNIPNSSFRHPIYWDPSSLLPLPWVVCRVLLQREGWGLVGTGGYIRGK